MFLFFIWGKTPELKFQILYGLGYLVSISENIQHDFLDFEAQMKNESWIHTFLLTPFSPDDINFDLISESIHISIAEAAEHVRLWFLVSIKVKALNHMSASQNLASINTFFEIADIIFISGDRNCPSLWSFLTVMKHYQTSTFSSFNLIDGQLA